MENLKAIDHWKNKTKENINEVLTKIGDDLTEYFEGLTESEAKFILDNFRDSMGSRSIVTIKKS